MTGLQIVESAQLDRETVTELAALVDQAASTDGVAPMSEQALIDAGRPGAVKHYVVRIEGRLAGYAGLSPAHQDHPPSAELFVGPRDRLNGVATALVEAVFAAAPTARIWAHGNLAGARAVAQRFELMVGRELWQMARPLDTGLPALPDAPAATTTRTYAGSTDDAPILAVNAAAFSWHPEQGQWTAADLAERTRSEWFDPTGLFLCFDTSGELLGFHWTKQVEPEVGEVYVVAVAPRAQGRGVGKWLTLVGLHHLRDNGANRVTLYTEATNEPAVHVYERLGFTVFSADIGYQQA